MYSFVHCTVQVGPSLLRTSTLKVKTTTGCVTVAFVPSVHIEDCEGWWLSGCCSSVAEHWGLKPEALGSVAGICRLIQRHVEVRYAERIQLKRILQRQWSISESCSHCFHERDLHTLPDTHIETLAEISTYSVYEVLKVMHVLTWSCD